MPALITPAPTPFRQTVELSPTEFEELYEGVRSCLMEAAGLPADFAGDDAELAAQCRRVLSGQRNSPRYFDFYYGFLPLFEKFLAARQQREATSQGDPYLLAFK